MRIRSFALLLGLLSVFGPACGQVVNMESGRVQMTELSGPWRFHTGDDAAWANPGFDASHWSLLRTSRPWSVQGYKGYTGMGWYRLQVIVPDPHQPLAFYLPNVRDSCQVFANGRLIGQVGELPPHPRFVFQNWMVFQIPADVLVSGQPLLIAIRVWHAPIFAARDLGGVFPEPRIGNKSAMEEWSKLQIDDASWQDAESIVELYGNLITALAGLGLFFMRRREREYLWFGLSQLCWAIFGAYGFAANFRPTGYYDFYIIFSSLYGVATLFQIEFLVAFLRQRRGFIYWAMVTCILGSTLANLHEAFAGGVIFGLFFGLVSLGTLVGELALIAIGARKGNVDAPWLLLPYSLMLGVGVAATLASVPLIAATASAQAIRQFLDAPVTWPFVISASQLAGAFEMFAVLFVLVRRYARSRQDEERMEAELEAARVVQKVLIPEDIPPIPGFQVHTVYKPAGQVGGDFFQVIPLDVGGALIAIGDVSGKGLPAAMTVSLLVGTFRTLAHYTSNPSEILSAMNQRMLARSKGGFTTCLVMRLDSDGALTIANAGHIAPYVGSREVQVVNGLPLGVAADSVYAEVSVRLGPEDHLTLITDGVVEARSQSGELFGFERTAAIADEPAEKIAEAAQAFGQEDDITVLSLTRRGSQKGLGPILHSPAISPA